jgi:hypothetical protein
MLIEHTIQRPNGSIHTIGSTDYHFAPNEEGAHVAEVENPGHAQRFLTIPGFQIYAPGADAPVEPAPVPPAPPVDPDSVPGSDADAPQPTPLEDMTDAEIAAVYEEVFGKKPHHKIKRDRLIDMIRKAPVKEAE